jgi:hypothetical protein
MLRPVVAGQIRNREERLEDIFGPIAETVRHHRTRPPQSLKGWPQHAGESRSQRRGRLPRLPSPQLDRNRAAFDS